MYEVIRDGFYVVGIRRLTDGTTFPLCPENSDYQRFFEWYIKQPPAERPNLLPSSLEPDPLQKDCAELRELCVKFASGVRMKDFEYIRIAELATKRLVGPLK